MSRKAVGVGLTALSAAVLGLVECGTTGVPGAAGDATAGAALFELVCARCHAAVLLKPIANLIVPDLGALSPAMSGITLTGQEIADLRAFLATQ
jgi:hypothetical protein